MLSLLHAKLTCAMSLIEKVNIFYDFKFFIVTKILLNVKFETPWSTPPETARVLKFWEKKMVA